MLNWAPYIQSFCNKARHLLVFIYQCLNLLIQSNCPTNSDILRWHFDLGPISLKVHGSFRENSFAAKIVTKCWSHSGSTLRTHLKPCLCWGILKGSSIMSLTHPLLLPSVTTFCHKSALFIGVVPLGPY